MALFRPPLLEASLDSGSAAERVEALVELARFADTEEELARMPPGSAAARARALVALARGELLLALRTASECAGEEPVALAQILSVLGRTEEALRVLEPRDDPAACLARAEIHLGAGEAAQAEHALPAELEISGRSPGLAARDEARLALARGLVALAGEATAPAFEALGAARDHALRSGAFTLAARAFAHLGEAHARCGNRWRALRSVTRALDLAASGRVAAPALAGIHAIAFAIYDQLGHRDLGRQALQAGHDAVIRIASAIDERAYRETFLIDNRDCQRLIGLWKGDAGWGLDLERG